MSQERLRALSQLRKTRDLSAAEWTEVATLMAQAGNAEQAAAALRQAARTRVGHDPEIEVPSTTPPAATPTVARQSFTNACCPTCHRRLTFDSPQPVGAKLVCGECHAEFTITGPATLQPTAGDWVAVMLMSLPSVLLWLLIAGAAITIIYSL